MLALQPHSLFDRHSVHRATQLYPQDSVLPRAAVSRDLPTIPPHPVLSNPADYYVHPAQNNPPNQDASDSAHNTPLLTEHYLPNHSLFPKRDEYQSPSRHDLPPSFRHPQSSSLHGQSSFSQLAGSPYEQSAPHAPSRNLAAQRYSYPPPVPLSPARHLSEPNMHNQFAPSYSLPSPVDSRFQYSQQPSYTPYSHRPSVLPSPRSLNFGSMADQRPGTAGSTASSGWDQQEMNVPLQSSSYATVPSSSPAAEDPLSPLHSNFSGSATSTSSTSAQPAATATIVHPSPPQFHYQAAPPAPHHSLEEDAASDPRPDSSGYLSGDPDVYARHLHPQAASSRPSSSSGALAGSQAPPAAGLSDQESPERTEALIGGPSDPGSTSSKTYSFVSLPGNAVKKRPRRRYDEIERLYHCSWPNCTKSYGTLNHLNAHIVMQRHGNKRTPAEFKDLRKQWRKAKKEEADRAMNARLAAEGSLGHHPQFGIPHHLQHQHHLPHPDTRSSPSMMRQQVSHYDQQSLGMGVPMHQLSGPGMQDRYLNLTDLPASSSPQMGMRYGSQPQLMYPSSLPPQTQGDVGQDVPGSVSSMNMGWNVPLEETGYASASRQDPHVSMPQTENWSSASSAQVVGDFARRNSLPTRSTQPYPLRSPEQAHLSVQQQRRNTLPANSTLLTPLPGYEPPPEYEEEETEEGGARYW